MRSGKKRSLCKEEWGIIFTCGCKKLCMQQRTDFLKKGERICILLLEMFFSKGEKNWLHGKKKKRQTCIHKNYINFRGSFQQRLCNIQHFRQGLLSHITLKYKFNMLLLIQPKSRT